MVKIRAQRHGAKKKPIFRVVVAEHSSRRDGKFIQNLGYYNPRSKEGKIDFTLVEDWKRKGAQTSDFVKTLLKKFQKEQKTG